MKKFSEWTEKDCAHFWVIAFTVSFTGIALLYIGWFFQNPFLFAVGAIMAMPVFLFGLFLIAFGAASA